MILARLAVIGLVVAASACGDSTGTGGGGNGGGGPCASSGADLVINATAGLAFSPRFPTITAGSTICWQATGGAPHTVTSDDGPGSQDDGTTFDGPLNNSASSVEHTFNTAGDFPYHCIPHLADGMTGTITVTAP